MGVNYIFRRLRCCRLWLFRLYWLLPIVAFTSLVLGLLFDWVSSDNQPLWLAFVTGSLAWTYFFQKQKLEEDKFFLDNFERFNKRFYELVDGLNTVLEEEKLAAKANETFTNTETDQENKNVEFSLGDSVIHKYFDLCLEEYQLYKANRIPEKIWKYWAKGMCYYLECPRIRKYWEEMDRNNLSDGLTVETLEKYVGE